MSKKFGGVVALDSVDLSVDAGEIVGLIGPNGSGKSTFLNIISGFYRPDRGTITYEARRIDQIPPHALPRIGIARTFQNLRLYDTLSVRDNLLIGQHVDFLGPSGSAWPWIGTVIGWPAAIRREREVRATTEEVLRRLRLLDVADRQVRVLSYGQRKRLELARASLIKPKLMLLDEPTAGLSPDEANEMLHVLRDLRSTTGVTMVVIEHRLEWMMVVSDRIAVLDAGRKTAEGTPDEIRHHPNVVAAYLGRSQ